jgi:hypothetical protein
VLDDFPAVSRVPGHDVADRPLVIGVQPASAGWGPAYCYAALRSPTTDSVVLALLLPAAVQVLSWSNVKAY